MNSMTERKKTLRFNIIYASTAPGNYIQKEHKLLVNAMLNKKSLNNSSPEITTQRPY